MRALLCLLRAFRSPRRRSASGPTTLTRLPSPAPTPERHAYPARPARPGLPDLPPDIDRQDEQRIRRRLRRLTGEE